MNFVFAANLAEQHGRQEAPTFTVDRLWQTEAGRNVDCTHLLDRSYGYHSTRELRWHLAQRSAVDVESLHLLRA